MSQAPTPVPTAPLAAPLAPARPRPPAPPLPALQPTGPTAPVEVWARKSRALWGLVIVGTLVVLVSLFRLGAGVYFRAHPVPLVSPTHHAQPVQLPAELTAADPAPTPLTTDQATAIVRAWWPLDEQARATDDLEVSDLLETGASRSVTDAVTMDTLQLGHNLRTVRPLQDLTVIVPPPGAGATSFFAQVLTTTYSANGATPFTEMLVFTRAGGRWEVALDVGAQFLNFPTYLPAPRLVGTGALPPQAVAKDLADWRTRYLRAGQDPGSEFHFAPGPFTTRLMADVLAERRAQPARTGGVQEVSTYRADLSSGAVFRFPVARGELYCYPEQFLSEASIPGQKVHQTDDRKNWGVRVAPGNYNSITYHGIRNTCLALPLGTGIDIVVIAGNAVEVGAETH